MACAPIEPWRVLRNSIPLLIAASTRAGSIFDGPCGSWAQSGNARRSVKTTGFMAFSLSWKGCGAHRVPAVGITRPAGGEIAVARPGFLGADPEAVEAPLAQTESEADGLAGER